MKLNLDALIAKTRPDRPRGRVETPVPIPWRAEQVRDPRDTSRPLGRFGRAKAARHGIGFNRDDDGADDLAANFRPSLYFDDYDQVAIQVSGGKDSVACVAMVMRLLAGRPDLVEKVEIWHQDVDAGGEPFMDWPVTAAYVRALGLVYGVRTVFAYREGGFLGEIRRGPGQARGPKMVVDPDTGCAVQVGKTPSKASEVGRLRFPAPSPEDMNARWCTNELKTDVARGILAGHKDFYGRKVLWITGERASESKKRVRYHRGQDGGSTQGRTVHQWRPVFDHVEEDVWAEMAHAFPGKRYGLQPHPAYELGWGRCSCAGCIFGGPAEWARLRQILPSQYARIVAEEKAAHQRARRRAPEVEPQIQRLQARREVLMREMPFVRASIRAVPPSQRAHYEREQEKLLAERADIDKEIRVLRGQISATIKAEGSIPELIAAAQARGPIKGATIRRDVLALWGPYARGETPWTERDMLRGPGAPVFSMPWTMPAGALSGAACGPP